MTSGASPPRADRAREAPLVASVVPLVGAWRTDRAFDYLVPTGMAGAVAGAVVRVPFGLRRVRGIVLDVAARAPERPLEAIVAVVVDRPVCGPAVVALARWTARRYVVPIARVLERCVPGRVRVQADPPEGADPSVAPRLLASYSGGPELAAAIETGASGWWCIRTVAGEQRGALIAELVSAAARSGPGSALVVVPEVRYGSAVLDAVSARHAGLLRVDSAQAERARAVSWLRLAAGSGAAGGGRSTLFAPASDLRLVVIDEEHHPSLKEDRSPRYDARLVALERARAQGAACVFVSGTPSLESGYACSAGRARSVTPTRAAERAARPIVEVVDAPGDRALSSVLHDRVRAALRAHEKVALLAPRRGFARASWCAGCRRSLRCPRCEAGLAYDRGPVRIRCPRCAWSGPAPQSCPSCGARALRFLGAGSERLAEQLALAFPRAAVRRVDVDVLDERAERPRADADIYVTTWIGTKPSLRPDVSLVGVLDADALIRRPNFRAAERAYQALAALAEWAGPGARGGRLVIQSSEGGHHAIQAVARADYTYFMRRELPLRAELGYPPFSELVGVTAHGPGMTELGERAAAACRAAGATVLGPVPVANPGGEPGVDLLAKCERARDVADALRELAERGSGTDRLRIDVDPR
jgi:primosomal protein N' (replication factor Y) (superfamily II helicase)